MRSRSNGSLFCHQSIAEFESIFNVEEESPDESSNELSPCCNSALRSYKKSVAESCVKLAATLPLRDNRLVASVKAQELIYVRDQLKLIAGGESTFSSMRTMLRSKRRKTINYDVLEADGIFIGELIAKGAHGSVYSGSINLCGKDVRCAIKIYSGSLADQTFAAEAAALSRLDSYNCVPLLYKTIPALLINVLEFIDSVDLSSTLLKTRLLYVHNLLTAVQCIHSARIYHRDLKRDNVLFLADGSVKVIDFSSAVMLDETHETSEYSNQDTPYYRSPEAFSYVIRLVPYAIDCWAAGVICYELLAKSTLYPDNLGTLGTAELKCLAEEVAASRTVYGISIYSVFSSLELSDYLREFFDRIFVSYSSRVDLRSFSLGTEQLFVVGFGRTLRCASRRKGTQFNHSFSALEPKRKSLDVGNSSINESVLSDASSLGMSSSVLSNPSS